jgi:hypothetical protein
MKWRSIKLCSPRWALVVSTTTTIAETVPLSREACRFHSLLIKIERRPCSFQVFLSSFRIMLGENPKNMALSLHLKSFSTISTTHKHPEMLLSTPHILYTWRVVANKYQRLKPQVDRASQFDECCHCLTVYRNMESYCFDTFLPSFLNLILETQHSSAPTNATKAFSRPYIINISTSSLFAPCKAFNSFGIPPV